MPHRPDLIATLCSAVAGDGCLNLWTDVNGQPTKIMLRLADKTEELAAACEAVRKPTSQVFSLT
jgi:hypothetical protein